MALNTTEETPRLALVTGATGYVGSNLTTELLKRGWRVRTLSRSRKKALSMPWGDKIVDEGENAGAGQVEVLKAMPPAAKICTKHSRLSMPPSTSSTLCPKLVISAPRNVPWPSDLLARPKAKTLAASYSSAAYTPLMKSCPNT